MTRLRRTVAAFGLALAAASPARAAQEWYDYYLRARDSDIPARRWNACLANLDRSLKLRASPANNVRTYGLQFVEYLPYYHRGLCLLRQEEFAEALEAFAAEEKAGAIRNTPQLADLLRLRAEAQSGLNAIMVRRARAEVDRMLREARELGRRGAYAEALSLLKQAEQLAKGLDAERERTVAQESERLRGQQREAAEASEAAARRQRLDQRVADGQRLLQEGRGNDARLAFDEAYQLDPRDTRAIEGRAAAAALILSTTTRENRRQAYLQGKALFDAGQYTEALGPLTDAAADPENAEAGTLLARARQVIEGLRVQRELRAQIDSLFARGRSLMQAGRHPDAQVAFEAVLHLDPGHAQARTLLDEAARKTGEALYARWLPNQEPTLALFEEPPTWVDVPRLLLRGVATDDRGIQKVEFRSGEQLIGTSLPAGSQPERTLRFVQDVRLEPGPNRLAVLVTDSGGLSRAEAFVVERRLRFHETRWFLPSALAGALTLLGSGWGAHRLRRRRALRRRFNPYIAGAPVLDEHMFFGRGKLTQRMLSTLHRNSLMITGERRIGKTTFLHHLKRVLAEDEAGEWKFFPVFVDLQGVPEEAFFHAMMAEVVDGLGLAPDTRQRLRFRPEQDDYEARDFSHDLPLVLAELRGRTEKKVKLALLIDEVDVLNEYSESVNQRLRGIFMKSFSENLVAVMSGVAIRRRWKSEVSPWYNFFDEIEVAPFSREDAEALIREPVAGVFRYDQEAVERILELSGLRPYLVQKFCVHAVARMLEDGRSRVTLQDVDAARAMVTEPESAPDPAATPAAVRD